MAISANYEAEALKRVIDINYSVEIEGVTTVFTKKPVSGLGGSQEPSLSKMTWNPPKLSLDSTKISIGTIAVTLIDPNGTLMAAIAAGQLHKKKLTLKRGFTNLDTADYNAVAEFKIHEFSSKDGLTVVIKGRDRIEELREPVDQFPKTILDEEELTEIETGDADVVSTAGFPSSGEIFIGDERIAYATTSATQFLTLTRGTDPASHKRGADVFGITTLQANPVDMMLQMLISPGGGGAYDVLSYGLGIDSSTINVASFEAVRDDSTLAGEVWKFEFTDDIKDLLKFFEDEIFQFSNTRIYMDEDGKIACALLQEATLAQFKGSIGEEDIIPLPATVTNSDRIANQLVIKYEFNPETNEFEQERTFNDTESTSQADFGVVPAKKIFKSRGIRQGLSGEGVAERFAKRYFRRVAEPFGMIKQMKTLWKRQFYVPGDKVKLTHPKIFDLTEGAVGLTDRLVEINSVKYDFDKGITTYEINNSPFLTNRFGFISPSSPVASGTSTTVFTLVTGEAARAEWEAGQVIDLYLISDGTDVSTGHTIQSVVGEVVTVSPAMSVTPSSLHGIRFSIYDSVTVDQKLFAFASDGTNNFGDGEPPYIVS